MNAVRLSAVLLAVFALHASQVSAQSIVAGPTTTNRLFDGLENLDFLSLGIGTDQPGIGALSRISAGGTATARGTSFTIGNAGETLNITGLALQSAASTFFNSNEAFTVAIFSGNAAGATIAPPAGNAANVNPAYLSENSSLTLIGAELFGADTITGSANGTGTIDRREFINFNFENTVTVDGGDDLTAFVFTNFEFEYIESGSLNAAGIDGVQGGRFQFDSNTAVLSPSQNRNLNFAILGEVQGVPEPSSLAVFGLGALGLGARRRRI